MSVFKVSTKNVGGLRVYYVYTYIYPTCVHAHRRWVLYIVVV